jgi:hypothetical protein
MTTKKEIVLWRENDWHCELHTDRHGSCRLLVYRGDVVAWAEAVVFGHTAHVRAEVLRRRILRGTVSLPQNDDVDAPDFT